MSLPSKKIILLSLCAITIVSVISIQKYYVPIIATPENEKLQNIDTSAQMQVQGINVSSYDSDGDGLPDWQEIITGTDINKTDTDGDGTLDGKELEESRDPLIAGPNDKTNTQAKATTTSDAKTISESVARNLFANTVYLSNTGAVNEENKAALVQNLISGVQNSFTYKQYKAESLGLIGNENVETYKFYASSFATLQVGMILQMQKNITKIQSNLQTLSDIYARQATELFALKVPKNLVDTHLKIVNNYSKGAAVFEAIAKEKEDPIKLPLAIRTYQDIAYEQPLLLAEVAQFIKNSGIIFTSNEAGGYWNAFQ